MVGDAVVSLLNALKCGRFTVTLVTDSLIVRLNARLYDLIAITSTKATRALYTVFIGLFHTMYFRLSHRISMIIN